jgi:hypothetical protein
LVTSVRRKKSEKEEREGNKEKDCDE